MPISSLPCVESKNKGEELLVVEGMVPLDFVAHVSNEARRDIDLPANWFPLYL